MPDGRQIAGSMDHPRLDRGALGSRNAELFADALKRLSFRLGFRSIEGLVERTVYRELLPRGLTALDDLDRRASGLVPA
jgi:chromosome partitioning protein